MCGSPARLCGWQRKLFLRVLRALCGSPFSLILATSRLRKELRLHRRSAYLFALTLIWVGTSGAHCMRNPFVMTPAVPQLLPQQPQMGDVANAVNENTAKVRSLRANQASIAMTDGSMPFSVNATL